jgi:hypothetical protein
MSPIATTAFDYTALSEDLASVARSIAERIRTRMRASIADTGCDLIEIKDQMPHGAFGRWIDAEFQMSERSAQNYMNAAKFLEGKTATVADLPPAVIYALAAPSAPSDVVAEIVAAAEAGEMPAAREIKGKLADAVAAQKAAAIEAAKSPAQRKRERGRRAADAAWRAAQQAEYAAREDARKVATEVALAFLHARMEREDVSAFIGILAGTDAYRLRQAFDAGVSV